MARQGVDKVLPFELRSGPSAVADILQWIMTQQGVTWLVHYLDDFLTLGPSSSSECNINMTTMMVVCNEASLPVEPSKTVGLQQLLLFWI